MCDSVIGVRGQKSATYFMDGPKVETNDIREKLEQRSN